MYVCHVHVYIALLEKRDIPATHRLCRTKRGDTLLVPEKSRRICASATCSVTTYAPFACTTKIHRCKALCTTIALRMLLFTTTKINQTNGIYEGLTSLFEPSRCLWRQAWGPSGQLTRSCTPHTCMNRTIACVSC